MVGIGKEMHVFRKNVILICSKNLQHMHLVASCYQGYRYSEYIVKLRNRLVFIHHSLSQLETIKYTKNYWI